MLVWCFIGHALDQMSPADGLPFCLLIWFEYLGCNSLGKLEVNTRHETKSRADLFKYRKWLMVPEPFSVSGEEEQEEIAMDCSIGLTPQFQVRYSGRPKLRH